MTPVAILLFVCFCGLTAAAKHSVSIANPQIYENAAKGTLTLECTQEGFSFDFTQFEFAQAATLTLGSTDQPSCQTTYPATDQQVRFPLLHSNNFKECGAVTTTNADRVIVSNTIKVMQQYRGPTDQKFNWITCATYNVQCCFVPGQPPRTEVEPLPVDVQQHCEADEDKLVTFWFQKQEGFLYWHEYLHQFNPLYEAVPYSCKGFGRDTTGKQFTIDLIRDGCVVDDPRMRLSVEKVGHRKEQLELTTENERLYAGVEVRLEFGYRRCGRDNLGDNDTNARCSTFWQNNQLKSCSASGTPLMAGRYPVQISRNSKSKVACKKTVIKS